MIHRNFIRFYQQSITDVINRNPPLIVSLNNLMFNNNILAYSVALQ